MGDRGGGDVGAPGILDHHHHGEAGAQVAGAADLGDAAELGQLQRHHVEATEFACPQE